MSTQALIERTPVGFGRGRRTNNIAIIHAARADFLLAPTRVSQLGPGETLDEWTLPALGGAAVSAEKNGFNIIWRYLRKHESYLDLVQAVFPANADAAVVLAPWEGHLAIVDRLAELEIPCVIAYARHPDPRRPWVACDNGAGVKEEVQHLVDLGHQRIGFVGGARPVLDFQERKQAFLEAIAAHGLSCESDLVVEALLRHEVDDVKPVALRLLRGSGRPTAVVCATDLIATAVIEAAWETGLRVPEDIAVVGFDDTGVATQITPQLTTVRQPVSQVASTATYLAACAVVGQEPETASWQVVLPVQVVVRESSGAGPGKRLAPQAAAGAPTSAEQQARMRQLEAVNGELLEMLYVAAHDLRAPLITISGFADLLERKFGSALGEAGKRPLSRIQRSAETMAKLLEALLSLSRSHQQPLVLHQVPVRGVVESVLRNLEAQIVSCRASVVVSPHLPEVIADELALHQVFMNLVSNALKYAGTATPPRIGIGCEERPEEYEFYVQDDGPGVPAEARERIFEPFQRGAGSEEEEGTGIGLSVVKSVVLRHGGRVWVESEPGQGTTFRFTLPRRESSAEASAGPAPGAFRPPPRAALNME